jgi:hypothetical protein
LASTVSRSSWCSRGIANSSPGTEDRQTRFGPDWRDCAPASPATLHPIATTVELTDRGRLLAFAFEDVLRYHGGHSPGGAALAFKALERALPRLDPGATCERREIHIATPFQGPGARDAFELLTRAVTEDRYSIDAALARPERGRALERFVFRFTYREAETTLHLREGFVTDEFIDLARTDPRDADQERRLDRLKQELAERVMSRPASDVYDAG